LRGKVGYAILRPAQLALFVLALFVHRGGGGVVKRRESEVGWWCWV